MVAHSLRKKNDINYALGPMPHPSNRLSAPRRSRVTRSQRQASRSEVDKNEIVVAEGMPDVAPVNVAEPSLNLSSTTGSGDEKNKDSRRRLIGETPGNGRNYAKTHDSAFGRFVQELVKEVIETEDGGKLSGYNFEPYAIIGLQKATQGHLREIFGETKFNVVDGRPSQVAHLDHGERYVVYSENE